MIFIYRKSNEMTRLGLFLAKKSINRAMVSRKTGISPSRMSQLSTNETTKLRADELYVIALALELDPCVVFKELYGDISVDHLLHES